MVSKCDYVVYSCLDIVVTILKLFAVLCASQCVCIMLELMMHFDVEMVVLVWIYWLDG